MDNEPSKQLNNLPDEELDAATGGYILDMGEGAGDMRYLLVRDSNGRVLDARANLEDIQNMIDKSNACAPEGFVLASKDVITPEQYKTIYGRTPYIG